MATIKNNCTIKFDSGYVCAFCVLFLVSTSGIKWIPIIQLGGYALELHNTGSIAGIIATLIIALLKKRFVLPKEFLTIFIVLLFVAVFGIFRVGKISDNVIVSLPALLGALVIVQISPFKVIKRYYYLSFLVLILTLFFSAKFSGADFFNGLLGYLASFNRNEFVFQTLRPIFNAFVNVKDEIIYNGSLVNHLASGFYLFFVISSGFIISRTHKFKDLIIATFSFFLIFSLFSSSVLGATLAAIAIALFFAFMQVHSRVWLLIGFLFVILIVPLVLPWIISYLSTGVSGETNSINTRAAQNSAALDSISNNLITGGGTISQGGHGLHNLPLFAWTEGGVLGFLTVMVLYVFCIASIINGLKYLAKNKDEFRFEAFLLATLPIFIIIRSLFGGGGGLPGSSEAVALGLMVSARRALGINYRIKELNLRSKFTI